MKKIKSGRSVYALKNSISNFFNPHYKLILLLTIMLVLGIVVGAFVSAKNSEVISLSNIPDAGLVNFISGNIGNMALFFRYFLWYSLFIFAIVFFNNSIILNILNTLYIFVLGYRLGFLVATLITLYFFAGIINCIIIIVPFTLIMYFIIILISAVAIHRYLVYKKFGCVYTGYNYAKLYAFLGVLFLIVLLVYCICLPVIRATIIVN